MAVNGNRWHTWGAASPIWGSGLILLVLGMVLLHAGLKAVRDAR